MLNYTCLHQNIIGWW